MSYSRSTTTRVLVVEDTSALRLMLCEYLRANGFEPIESWSVEGATRAMETGEPDLAMLDLMLDDGEGYDLVRTAARHGIPSMILSSKSSPLDRILCLELGADDYLVKPFELREMLLRLRRLRRLAPNPAGAGEAPSANTVRIGRASVDLVDRTVSHPSRQDVGLTETEFRLLRLLIENRGSVLGRDRIVTEVFSRSAADDSRRVDVLVSKLRRKIDDDDRPSVIVNIRNTGYLFQPPRTGL